jgi:alanine racemase
MTREYRVWAEIDLDRLAQNAARVRAKIGPGPRLLASVKADAYGHGAVPVANALLYSGVDELGVATCAEGVELRAHHIHVPVLIFGCTQPWDFFEVIKHNLTQTVFNYDMARALSGQAVQLASPARVHIKIDTGMGRLGFIPGPQSLSDILRVSRLPNLLLTGIYTHFADSDGEDQTFTREQYARFVAFCDALAAAGAPIPLRHAANSGAVVGCPGVFLDMARSGILLYGLKPSAAMPMGDLEVAPVMSLKSKVGFVKPLPPGASVGYGRTYVTRRDTFVATLPVGYADGYPRVLSNRGRVLINGKYAPVIGTICMDQMMVDVTECGPVEAGQEAVLIGGQGGAAITADEVAAHAGTISYEIVCGLGRRVYRVYRKGGRVTEVRCPS